MPPAIEDYDYGRGTRLPIQATQGIQATRRGLSEGQRYSSPYVPLGEPSTGRAAPSQPAGPSSHSYGNHSTLRGPYGEVEPAFDVTHNPAPRLPMQQQQQSYNSSGLPSQYGAPPLVPYQVQRSPQYQGQRSAQSALGGFAQFVHPGQQLPGLAMGRAQQPYQAPYSQPRPPHSDGSGHGHDFSQPEHQAQYPSRQQATNVIRYNSPYYSGPPQISSASSYPPNQQGYSSTPMQVAVPMYRHIPYQPSLSQHIPYSAESSVYPESSPSPAPSPGPSRRGRPPTKGKTTNPSKLAIEIISSPVAIKKRGRPSQNAQGIPPIKSISRATGSGSGPKKRGRPFKSIEAATKAKQKANGTYTPKKRGRPHKVRHQPEVVIPQAEYVAFLCEWIGCKAELHNLETLRRHVIVIHGEQDEEKKYKEGMREQTKEERKKKREERERKEKKGKQDKKEKVEKVGENEKKEGKDKKHREYVRVCAWGKCGVKVEPQETDDVDELLGDPNPNTNTTVFTTEKDWLEHIEVKHLVPFAWHMGDGPKATSFEVNDPDAIDPWLLNDDGNEVTPSFKNQTIEAGIARVNNLKRWNKEMRKLNLTMNSEEPTGSFMKTQAQIVQEEAAEGETGTGTGSGEADEEVDGSTGDDTDENDAGNEQEGMNDGEQVEDQSGSEGRDEDSGADPMVLDTL